MNKILVVLAILVSGAALAEGPDKMPCSHPVFMTHDCAPVDGKDGEDGKDGKNGKNGLDGKDGKDGVDGKDGLDGRDGINGIDGINGRDGVVPTDWYNDLMSSSVALSAATAYLPQDKDSRLTFGFANAGGYKGLGLGYAYVIDREDNFAFTLALGRASDVTVGNVTIGWEF
jgi:hypothetical protein